MIQAAVDPRPRLGADEVDGLVERRAGDAGVDRRLDDLEDGAVRGGAVIALVAGHEIGLGHLDLVDQHGAAGGGALAEAGPVVDHGQARCVALGDRIPGAPFVIEGDDRHQVGEQRAGRVELAPGDQHVVAVIGEAGVELGRALAAELGEGVAEPQAAQHLAEQQRLLGFVRDRPDGGDDAQVILRDLPDAKDRRPK